jgi:hypothetical protein
MTVTVLGQKESSVQHTKVYWFEERGLQMTDGSRRALSEEFERVMQATG